MRDDGAWSLDVVCEYGESACECLYIHQSESICERWEDEYIGASVYLGEFTFALGSEEHYLWEGLFKRLPEWTITDDDLGSWCLHCEEVSDIFLYGNASDEEEYRMGKILEECPFPWAERHMVDSEWYDRDLLSRIVVLPKVVLHILTRYDDASRGIVDISEGSVYVLLLDEWHA